MKRLNPQNPESHFRQQGANLAHREPDPQVRGLLGGMRYRLIDPGTDGPTDMRSRSLQRLA